MRAALQLRLLEARRRGAGWLLLGGFLLILATALFGGGTVDGRYGLATDLAATLAYAAAIGIGAFPLAIDRERRRSYLPSASPVTPWGWALGNAAAAAIVVFCFAVTLFAAAGLGTAMRGGIETARVKSLGVEGGRMLGAQPLAIGVPEGTTHLRLMARTYLVAEQKEGTEEAARIDIDGAAFPIYHERPVVLPVQGNPVRLRNRTESYAVVLDLGSVRALYEDKPFVPNALLAGIPPALAAAALAAIGVAAGAHLAAPVAALALAALLLLASMRGFLLEMIEFEGSLQRSQTTSQAGAPPDRGTTDGPARAFAKSAIVGLLHVTPAIGPLDRSGEVSTGYWVGTARIPRALLLLAGALALATLTGGVGVALRRTP
ncbi:MAG: hypothetical protein AAGD14_01485 [Planctomycetota bacterium]